MSQKLPTEVWHMVQSDLIHFRLSDLVFVENCLKLIAAAWNWLIEKNLMNIKILKSTVFHKKYHSCTIDSFPSPSKKETSSRDFGHLSLIQNDSYFQIAQNQIKSHKSSFELNLSVVLINNPKFRVEINRSCINTNRLLPSNRS